MIFTGMDMPTPVPIYDARHQLSFNFSKENLSNLQWLPLYRNNKKDPEGDSFVCMTGYSVNFWNRTRSGQAQPCISLNILFVIILGKLTPA